jgi:GxxExxY protein
LYALLSEVTLATAAEINRITSLVIGAAIQVHRVLGPGLLENAYASCLHYELQRAGLPAQSSRRVPLVYKEVRLECAYVADLVVGDWVLVEVKAVDSLAPVHFRQVATYIRLADLRVGLLINFGATILKNGTIAW